MAGLKGGSAAAKTRGFEDFGRRFVVCVVQVVALFVKRTRYLAQSVAHRLASSSASTGWYQSGLFTCVLSR